WREEVEVAELLTQLHRLVGDALQLVVVTNFNETGEREVLAQRIAFETVVGQDAAQVRMAGKQDAVHVVGFALEPFGADENRNSGRHQRVLVSLNLDADALVLARRHELVDDIEALGALRIVDARNIRQVDELALHIVAQEGQNADDAGNWNRQGQLAIGKLRLFD